MKRSQQAQNYDYVLIMCHKRAHLLKLQANPEGKVDERKKYEKETKLI